MAYREVSVSEAREVLRVWLSGSDGLRRIGELSGVDRKTVRRYVAAAEELGVDRGGEQLGDPRSGFALRRGQHHRRPAQPRRVLGRASHPAQLLALFHRQLADEHLQ